MNLNLILKVVTEFHMVDTIGKILQNVQINETATVYRKISQV